LKWVVIILLLVAFITPLLFSSYRRSPKHYVDLAARCQPQKSPGCANQHSEKIFIAISLYDRGGALAGGKWGQTLLDLIYLLGPDNVFLSIYENDSDPAAASALRQLKDQVSCRSEIVSEGAPSLDTFPTVDMPDGTKRVKRIAYLAEIRNRALRPLGRAGQSAFDKVLFLNDVFFDPLDAAHLLFNTNADPSTGRGQYLSACALDFFTPLRYYDIYALRDADGYYSGSTMFPFFTSAGRGQSRADVLAQRDAVRVRSCWGGMVAVQAQYLQGGNETLAKVDTRAAESNSVDPDVRQGVAAPVQFRHEPGLFYDASECCLFQADVKEAARSAGAKEEEAGIFVNPYVRVAYTPDVLWEMRITRLWERLLVIPSTLVNWWDSRPWPNPYREVRVGEEFREEIWADGGWKVEQRRGRPGMFCGVREMQVILQKRREEDGANYVSTRIPPGQSLEFPMLWGKTLPENWEAEFATCTEAQKKEYWDSPFWKPAVTCLT
jgi:hypothetical protein